MVSTILHGMEYLFGNHLALWATQAHTGVLSLLVIVWGWPLLAEMFRRMPSTVPDIEWVQLWRCPKCNTFNRRSFTICTHCEYHLTIGGTAKWVPLWLSEKIKRSARTIVSLYRLCGWVLFYGLTLLAFWKLRLYTFRQDPRQELLACITMALLLLSLLFFYFAFRPRRKSPLGGLMDAAAGLVMSSLLLFSLLVWSASSPPNRPLAYITVSASGQIDVHTPGGSPTILPESLKGHFLSLSVRYGVLSWPFFGFRHAFITDLSGKSLMPAGWLFLGDKIALLSQKEGSWHPRLILLTQTLGAAPETSYMLHEAEPGLALTKIPLKKPQ